MASIFTIILFAASTVPSGIWTAKGTHIGVLSGVGAGVGGGDGVGEEVGFWVGILVGDAIGAAVGEPVGVGVPGFVGKEVGNDVGNEDSCKYLPLGDTAGADNWLSVFLRLRLASTMALLIDTTFSSIPMALANPATNVNLRSSPTSLLPYTCAIDMPLTLRSIFTCVPVGCGSSKVGAAVGAGVLMFSVGSNVVVFCDQTHTSTAAKVSPRSAMNVSRTQPFRCLVRRDPILRF